MVDHVKKFQIMRIYIALKTITWHKRQRYFCLKHYVQPLGIGFTKLCKLDTDKQRNGTCVGRLCL